MPDRTIGFRLRPHARYRWTDEGFSEGRINAAGWRDRDYAEAKPAGITRILFLGDSYTEALQVPLDSTFHKRLERDLNARASGARRYEVPALGRSGMGTTEEYLTYEKWGARYDPDVVAVLFVLNDFTDNTREIDTHRDIRPYFVERDSALVLDTSFVDSRAFRARSRIDALKAHSSLIALATKTWNDLQARRALAQLPAARDTAVSFEFDARLAPDSIPAFRITAKVLARFARQVHADGRRFVVFVSGEARQEDRAMLARALQSPHFDPEKPQRFLESLGAREGFDVVPLTPGFRAASAAGAGPLWCSLHGSFGHWNSSGHAVAAEEMEAYFRSGPAALER